MKEFKKHFRPGGVYRRADLLKWSKSVDRHLAQLVKDGTLTKVGAGLYYCPEEYSLGTLPPTQYKLVKAFLRDHRFVITDFNYFNGLGVGTTQLYFETLVYNHKRQGKIKIGEREFNFQRRHNFPLKLTKEFVMVDLLNCIDRLAEDDDAVLEKAVRRAREMDRRTLLRNARDYGNVRAQKFFEKVLTESELSHAA